MITKGKPARQSLIKYFRGGSAEEEKEIRGEIFVQPGSMSSLLSFDFHSSTILLGNKGVGKSIFVNVLHEAYLKNKELSVFITSDDLECDPILSKKTLSDRKGVAYAQMIKSIAGIIGKHSNSSEIAISSDVTALQKLAIKEGYAKSDLISKFSRILSKVTPVGEKVASSILAEQSRTLNKNNLTEVVDAYLTDRNKMLWLFIDDLDGAISKNAKGVFDYGALWAIISAAIELSEDISNIRCIISIRSDIWHLMTKTHQHGSERKDKLGHIHELKFSEDDLQKIFNRRIELAANDAGKPGSGVGEFFQNDNILLPGQTGARRPWNQWVAKISRNRPRDMVKVVQMLIKNASGAPKIGDTHAHEILFEYGKERINNIIDEYGQICPQIESVINDFSEKMNYSFLEVLEKLKKAPTKRGIQVDGISLQPERNDYAISLLRILHMACFINPRIDSTEEYTHFNYQEFPNIVDLAKFNDLQKYTWQIHPTFHTYLTEIYKKEKYK